MKVNNVNSLTKLILHSTGVLKQRWRCLLKDRVLHYAPPVAAKIINACAAMHNICIERDSDYYFHVEPDDEDVPLPPANPFQDGDLFERGTANRNFIVNYMQDNEM